MIAETGDTQGRDASVATTPPVAPRRVLILALLRSVLSVAVVVAVYFWLPLAQIPESQYLVELIVGIVVVVIVLILQTGAVMRSPYPLVRTVEALSTTGPIFLVLFATTHVAIELSAAGSYSEPMTKLDALYFTVTTFATVGFGDISPVSQAARSVTLAQMVLGLILVGIIARVITSAQQLAVQRHRDRQSRSADPDRSG